MTISDDAVRLPNKKKTVFIPCPQPVNHFTCPPSTKRWVRLDLNQGPRDYESPALTAELRTRHGYPRLPDIPCKFQAETFILTR